jgi:hypothetical protein
MKTTIDIPEALYKKAKIRAVQRGQTLKRVVLDALQRELEAPGPDQRTEKSFWEERKLLPDFARLQAGGAFRPAPGDRDITGMISEDRDGR